MAAVQDEAAARIAGMIGPEAVRLVTQALFVGAQAIQVDAQISITEGAISGKGHVPSKPGEPPNQDTGNLANNIEASQPDGPDGLRADVSSNAEYAAALEFGTSKMAERPYMRPAADKNRDKVPALVARAVEKSAGIGVDINVGAGHVE